jgi:aldose 1-epimerase
MINANYFTPINETLIPTGDFREVEGTPMDFTQMHAIGKYINSPYQQLEFGKGYDHNYVLAQSDSSLNLAARVYEPSTGRVMKVYTDEPGLQFYSGNFLDGSDTGRDGVSYQYRSAFCLEAQHYPDSPNHENFPSTVLEPGDTYKQTTIYKFYVKDN